MARQMPLLQCTSAGVRFSTSSVVLRIRTADVVGTWKRVELCHVCMPFHALFRIAC